MGLLAARTNLLVSGANAAGISPSDFTVFDGQLVFRGLNASGRWQLWETDGTAAGTHVLLSDGGARGAKRQPSQSSRGL